MEPSSYRNLSPVGQSSLWQIGLKFLRESLGEMDLKYKLIEGILYMVKQERINSTLNGRDTIAKLVHILLAL